MSLLDKCYDFTIILMLPKKQILNYINDVIYSMLFKQTCRVILMVNKLPNKNFIFSAWCCHVIYDKKHFKKLIKLFQKLQI